MTPNLNETVLFLMAIVLLIVGLVQGKILFLVLTGLIITGLIIINEIRDQDQKKEEEKKIAKIIKKSRRTRL